MKENEAQCLLWLSSDADPEIDLETFMHWRVSIKEMPTPTRNDLRHLSSEECTDIYRFLYFTPIRFDLLPSGIDYCVLDTAICCGPSRSIQFLQEAIGFKYPNGNPKWKNSEITGDFDLRTLWIIKNRDPEELVKEFMLTRWYRQKKILDRKQLTTPEGFDRRPQEKIWIDRNHKVLQRSLNLLEKR
jgi:lysozyme family protein